MRILPIHVFSILLSTFFSINCIAQSPLTRSYEDAKNTPEIVSSELEAETEYNTRETKSKVTPEYLTKLKQRSRRLAIWGTVLFLGGIPPGILFLNAMNNDFGSDDEMETSGLGGAIVGGFSLGCFFAGITCWVFSGVFKKRRQRLEKIQMFSFKPTVSFDSSRQEIQVGATFIF